MDPSLDEVGFVSDAVEDAKYMYLCCTPLILSTSTNENLHDYASIETNLISILIVKNAYYNSAIYK